jgi:predicted nucleic-acid-binding protein
MVGLDTNVLVRYLAQDDAAQSARATRLVERELSEREPGYIGLVVLVETCWVLRRLYGATPDEVRQVVRDLLAARQLVVEQRALVARALARLGDKAGDLADALIAEGAAEAGCARTVTFDRTGMRLGMELLR